MSGLLEGALPYLFSRIDAAKRTTQDALKQLVTDPQGLLAMRGAQLDQATKPLNGLFSGDPQQEAAARQAMDAMGPGLLGMTVYHGSPFKFDAFDASKIGTGEGAQAYGHGLYMAENPSVADTYRQGGHTYSVDLPDEQVAAMLHWDKPMTEQPANVQAVLGMNDPAGFAAQSPQMTGQQAYNELALAMQGGRPAAADFLNSQGIPGIRYADQGSRNRPGTGTSNFVVFPGSTNILKILGAQ